MSATCSYTLLAPGNGEIVASGLPTDQVINLMKTVDGATSSRILGYTTDSTWSVSVPEPITPTEYEFIGRTKGKDGVKYTIFCGCVAS